MDNRTISNLLGYINYFEDGNIKFCEWQGGEKCDNHIIMSYPSYDGKLLDFIKAVYDSDLMMKGYLKYLEDKYGTDYENKDIIINADFESIRAILTYYIREERFCYRAWEDSVKNGTFSVILKRLEELIDKGV